MANIISMKQLLEAGVHFGHQTRRWNPKMQPFIFMDRNGIHIIDLQQTVTRLNEAYKFVEQLAANGETILFVGTKKQAQEAVAEEAKRCGMYYVNQRWLGGMLTNFQTSRVFAIFATWKPVKNAAISSACPKKKCSAYRMI